MVGLLRRCLRFRSFIDAFGELMSVEEMFLQVIPLFGSVGAEGAGIFPCIIVHVREMTIEATPFVEGF